MLKRSQPNTALKAKQDKKAIRYIKNRYMTYKNDPSGERFYMTRKFHTEKHLKKRQRHLIAHHPLKPQEKMAERKEKITDATEKVEPEIKITPPAVATSPPPQPPSVPMMAQRTFQFTKEKSRFEKLKDTFHQLMNRFK
jgi:hypothetical protein